MLIVASVGFSLSLVWLVALPVIGRWKAMRILQAIYGAQSSVPLSKGLVDVATPQVQTNIVALCSRKGLVVNWHVVWISVQPLGQPWAAEVVVLRQRERTRESFGGDGRLCHYFAEDPLPGESSWR
jgi:hypothetical protein